MKVVYAIPTINSERAARAAERWRDMGYGVALWLCPGTVTPAGIELSHEGPYPGWCSAINWLTRRLVEPPYNADIVVTGGDDMDPDPKQRAAEIAEQFEEHFHGTLGVMQPTGDIASSPNCDMICGSPWLGAEWIRRAYRGSGPLWPEYNHFFGDEELQAVAVRHGLLWQRSDLCQHHDHWLVQGGPPKTSYQHHMDTWWPHDETIFRWRKRQAFPGSELLDTPMTATIPEPTR